jgi:outer membrane protein assembly factor BamB
MIHPTRMLLTTAMCLSVALTSVAETPTQWGNNPTRNNVVDAKDLPDHLGDDNRLWDVELHGRSFYNIITIHDGKVYCGMSADNLPERLRSRGPSMLCLDLKTGEVIWQKKLADRGGAYGLSTVPVFEDERMYVQADGNIVCLNKDTGEVIWNSDELHRPYFNTMHGAHGTGLILGDEYWVPTGHATGSDCSNWYSNSIEQPFHPNVVVLDKHTGKLMAMDDVPIGGHQHGSWASISTGEVNGKQLVFWGDAHGYIHAFEAPKGGFEKGKVSTIKEVWRCDANPAEYRRGPDGVPLPYAAYMGQFGPRDIGPCEIISTPVFYQGKVYAALARDKAYGSKKGKRSLGNGAVVCIDPTGTGDVTDTHKVWTNPSINRTFSTPSLVDDRLYISDHAGYLTCLNIASGGQEIWKKDFKQTIWNYFHAYGDGKIFLMNEGRDFFIFRAADGEQLFHAEMDASNNPQPGMTDGMLIVGTRRAVTAYGGPEYMKTHEPMKDVPDRKPLPDDGKGGH